MEVILPCSIYPHEASTTDDELASSSIQLPGNSAFFPASGSNSGFHLLHGSSAFEVYGNRIDNGGTICKWISTTLYKRQVR
jgi:hypothetical protein